MKGSGCVVQRIEATRLRVRESPPQNRAQHGVEKERSQTLISRSEGGAAKSAVAVK